MIVVILYCASAVTAGVFLVGLRRLLRAKRLFRQTQLLTGAKMIADLPSVSVCIPARNESHAMADCLDAVIASTYPKLEIIVLNDQSNDSTSPLIKAYAHDGVRFVEGAPLQPQWLGKNHALHELLQQASGTYVLFMDVDTRIAPDTIEQLVAYAQQQDAAMVSVLPRREDGIRLSTLFSPLRYLWTLLFHSNTLPAVASSAWMIRRTDFLDTVQAFDGFKNHIQPEAAIAKLFAATNQYRFLIGTTLLGVSYEKKWSSQRDTSIRLLFPLLQLHTVIAAIGLLSLSSPLALLITALIQQDIFATVISAITYCLCAFVLAIYFKQVWRKGAVIGGLLWPVLIVQEAILMLISRQRYAENKVTWKGRPVRMPTTLRSGDQS